MTNKYTIEIFFSEEDEGFIAVVPELPGCSAFGISEEKALEEVKIAIELWIEAAKKDGREIPEPYTFENASEYADLYSALQRLTDPDDKTLSIEEVKESLGI